MTDPALEVVLDISRLLSRVMHTTPTGVDRVEMAYATGLLDRLGDAVSFSAVHPVGGLYGRLPTAAVRQFLASTAARWQLGQHIDRITMRRTAIAHLFALRPRPVPRSKTRRIYVQASPHHLDREDRVGTILHRESARMICMVHDLIPLMHPEYARVNGAQQHFRRVRTIAKHASGIISNSGATQETLLPYIKSLGKNPELCIAHLGVDETDGIAVADKVLQMDAPYFICVATIEPRKNHLLLLNIWRRMQEASGDTIPKLVLVGRRGWENEQIVDMLERCAALQGNVIETGTMPDRQMKVLLSGARALLLPSFAEGFGMPVTEALIAGVPVIASDLPALREAGGPVAEYLDPLDGPAWMAAVRAYSEEGDQRRAAQLLRMKDWRPPTWDSHMETVIELIHKVNARA